MGVFTPPPLLLTHILLLLDHETVLTTDYIIIYIVIDPETNLKLEKTMTKTDQEIILSHHIETFLSIKKKEKSKPQK